MSKMRKLSFMQHGDFISYNKIIYKVDWSLTDNNNVINAKTNEPFYIDEDERVKWLENYDKVSLVK